MVQQEALQKRAEEKFRRMVESSPNAMVLINREGKIIFVNAQTESLFGYSREEIIDQSIEILFPKRLRSKHPGFRANFFAHPASRALGTGGDDLFGIRKDGHE